MSVMPASKKARIEFAEAHVEPFSENATVLNISPTLLSTFTTRTANAREKYEIFKAAQAAVKNAVIEYNVAVQEMTDSTSDCIKQVRATAAVQGDGIYALASLPVPAQPSPIGAPGTAYDFKAQLMPDGSLKLTWACDNPRGSVGTLYHVYRRTTPGTQWMFVGGSGSREWADNTLPAGLPRVYYSVQAVRSTAIGAHAEFVVNFGVDTAGVTTATVEAAPKLAA